MLAEKPLDPLKWETNGEEYKKKTIYLGNYLKYGKI